MSPLNRCLGSPAFPPTQLDFDKRLLDICLGAAAVSRLAVLMLHTKLCVGLQEGRTAAGLQAVGAAAAWTQPRVAGRGRWNHIR